MRLVVSLCVLVSGVAGAVGCPAFPSAILPPPPPPGRVDVTALAGPDLVVLEGSRVVLSGNASRALGGDPVLSWAQLDGPPVLLTNPSSPLPAFVAPVAPATLRFQLRAEASGAVALDEVVVDVESASSGDPVYIEVPPDVVAEGGSQHTFDVLVRGADPATITLNASASCDAGAAVTVDGTSVTVTLPQSLPCIVVVDGVDAAGRGIAPAARVFWQPGTALPAATEVTTTSGDCSAAPSFQFDPGSVAQICFRGGDSTSVRAWAAGGDDDVIPGGVLADDIAFNVPRREAHLVIAGERRLGGASGGVRYAAFDVTAGHGNVAPVARGGPDRVVPPGARFRLDTSQSFDINGGALSIVITQVIGPSAAPDADLPNVFTAPAIDAGADVTMLFHVVADDGTVLSAPDPVRVLVSNGALDAPPVLTLPDSRFVVPGQTFVVDASSAEDPDSGIIAAYAITQAQSDPVVLDPFADGATVTTASVELVAGAAGDVYHFQIAAFDAQGEGVTVDQSVTVEDAGPYVDPVRGNDVDGNGTAAAPFASVAAALPTAIRHELGELLLAEGTYPAVSALALPPGLSLRGQQHFVDSAYVDGTALTALFVVSGGLSVVGGRLQALTVALEGGSITLEGTSALDHVTVTETADHTEPLVLVDTGAAGTLVDAVLTPAAAHDDASVVLAVGSTVTVVDSTIAGAPGDLAVGVHCSDATMVLSHAHITGGASAQNAVGVRADPGCVLDASASTIEGGAVAATGSATGVMSLDSLVTLDDASAVVGATSDADAGTALQFAGRSRSALVHGSLAAGADGVTLSSAVGLAADDAQVSLDGAHVSSVGAAATAARMNGGVLVASGATLTATTTGIDLSGLIGAQLNATSISAATAVSCADEGSISLSDATLQATSAGIVAAAASVDMAHTTVVVDGTGTVSGVTAASAGVADSSVDVNGDDASAFVVVDAVFQRSVARAVGTTATTLSSTGTLSLQSSFVVATGGTAVSATGPVTLRQATLIADLAALHVEADNLDAANSVLAGEPGLDAGSTPWARAASLAFQSGSTLVKTPTDSVTDQNGLDALSCDLCLVVDIAALIDATGHLVAGANDLVDAADPSLSLADDIDGDARPQGPKPDIGCDERAP